MNSVNNEDDDKCTCKEEEDVDSNHICPYAADINDDFDSQCNCCRYCTRQCAMDI